MMLISTAPLFSDASCPAGDDALLYACQIRARSRFPTASNRTQVKSFPDAEMLGEIVPDVNAVRVPATFFSMLNADADDTRNMYEFCAAPFAATVVSTARTTNQTSWFPGLSTANRATRPTFPGHGDCVNQTAQLLLDTAPVVKLNRLLVDPTTDPPLPVVDTFVQRAWSGIAVPVPCEKSVW
jgi:hypothetical protein